MTPCFLPLPSGPLAAIIYHARPDAGGSSWIIHCPAFAEEMNKSRRMVSLQAKAFAENGYNIVVPDLYGTGDSPGEFAEANWLIWQDNLAEIISWVRQTHGAAGITLWGLRSGCLLAVQTAAAAAHHITGILLWQPIPSGQQFISQFLRLRVARSLNGPKKETVKELRQLSANGHPLEVAGYLLSPELVASADTLNLQTLELPAQIRVGLVEVTSSDQLDHSPVILRILDSWRERNITLHHLVIQSAPFWSTQEISWSTDLIDASLDLLKKAGSVPQPVTSDFPQFDYYNEQLRELAMTFICEGVNLPAVIHRSSDRHNTGVLLVVGGPQYRAGSHRQFLLLARYLASHGFSVMRFDYRGMGDGGGEPVQFDNCAADIAAAVDAFTSTVKTIDKVCIWGLCDAATAAVFYAPKDPRISSLCLLNPWVHTDAGQAEAYLRRYYISRLFSRNFWQSLASGKVNVIDSISSLWQKIKTVVTRKRTLTIDHEDGEALQALDKLFLDSFDLFKGRALVILSENDLTSQEFKQSVVSSQPYRKKQQTGLLETKHLESADHTFSSEEWRSQVQEWTLNWLEQRI